MECYLESVFFLYKILISKVIDNFLPENILTNELNDNNVTIQAKIEKVNNGEEEDVILIKADNLFISSWKENILDPFTNLNLFIE